MGQKGDDVVLGLALDRVDPGGVELDITPSRPDGRGRFLGMVPSSAMASAAWASISNQIRYLVRSDQMSAMAGRV
jgi:hypothetical protein